MKDSSEKKRTEEEEKEDNLRNMTPSVRVFDGCSNFSSAAISPNGTHTVVIADYAGDTQHIRQVTQSEWNAMVSRIARLESQLAEMSRQMMDMASNDMQGKRLANWLRRCKYPHRFVAEHSGTTFTPSPSTPEIEPDSPDSSDEEEVEQSKSSREKRRNHHHRDDNPKT